MRVGKVGRLLHSVFHLAYVALLLPVSGYIYIETNPQDKSVIEGGDTILRCDTSTAPEDVSRTHIRWKFRDHLINGTSSKYLVDDGGRDLVIRRVSLKDSGPYTCIASVGVDQDMKTAKLSVKAKPSAPVDVQVINCLATAAEILWQPGKHNEEITNYMLQFNTSSEPQRWHTYHEAIAPEARMTIVTLSPWGVYSFRMLSQNVLGYSEPSAPTRRTCETPPDRPDSNPENVRTVTDKKGKLIITWTVQPKLQHNGPGFGYKVSWRPRYSVYWHEENISNPLTDRLEVPVKTVFAWYEMKVRSQNNLGESFQPPYVKLGRSGEAEPTVVPKDFRINPSEPITPTTAHFIWESVDTSEGKIHGSFRGYRIQYWKSSEGRQHLKEVDVIISNGDKDKLDVRASITGLPPYTALRAQVSVMNTHYTGLPSQIIDFMTAEGVPSKVRDLRVETSGDNYVILKWLKPLHARGVILSYDIGYQSVSKQVLGTIEKINPGIQHVRITGLKAHTRYRFYIWARTRPGKGEPASVDFVTGNAVENDSGNDPNAPRVTVAEVGSSYINITWTAAYNQHVFSLQYRTHGSIRWKQSNLVRHKLWRVLRKLRPHTSYQIRVIAKTPDGNSSTSRTLNFTTKTVDGRRPFVAASSNVRPPYTYPRSRSLTAPLTALSSLYPLTLLTTVFLSATSS